MKASFVLLTVCNLLLMSLTAVLGLMVEGADGFARHFLLGLLAAFFGCFVQIVAFMYFVIQEKIVRQAALNGDVEADFHQRVMTLKSRALRLSLAGIGSLLVTVALGASIDIYAGATVHFIAAFAAIGVQAVAGFFQFSLIHVYREEAGRRLE